MKSFTIENLFPSIEPLFGRTADDLDLQAVLKAMGRWPLPEFEPEEFVIFLEDKEHGFCLEFDDTQTAKLPGSKDKPPRTAIFRGCFFFAEGYENYHAFSGSLPCSIVWTDTASSLVTKLGTPKNEIMNKKTGILNAHRWAMDGWMLTASYRNGGSFLRRIYAGV